MGQWPVLLRHPYPVRPVAKQRRRLGNPASHSQTLARFRQKGILAEAINHPLPGFGELPDAIRLTAWRA
jgi:hypothetical protein